MNEIFNSDFFIMSMRLLLVIVLSGLIGFEREINKHSAGFRTHILVGVSSCLMMLLSLYGFEEYSDSFPEFIRFDPARIPSYVISGIGFLGAGTIIVTGVNVKGLTTAASIWAVAGLGLVVGVGMIEIAILTTVIIIFSLFFLNNVEKLINKKDNRNYLLITVTNIKVIDRIFSQFNDHNVEVSNINFEKTNQEDTVITLDLLPGKTTVIDQLYHDLLAIEHVKQVRDTKTV
ncbi:MgtC/SapB family protein [Amphibacillus indicireducens]|uniref:MgtC/SapB family protein n=2 Tax=Amphibacillus indicireducens TaxID=1076330 RepID=A0ABP7VD75_9BACI